MVGLNDVEFGTIGIDLGARCGRVGALVGGVLRIFANDDGTKGTMSAFSLKKGKYTIGTAALNTMPANIIYDACRDHKLNISSPTSNPPEKPSWYCEYDEKGRYEIVDDVNQNARQVLYQQEVIAFVLQGLKELAESNLQKCVNGAVISVPSYSSNNYRRVVKQAATIAGFDHVQLVNQSTAAAITYKLNNSRHKENRYIAVLNMGAASTEVSVFSIINGKTKMISTAGSAQFGGDCFTHRLVDAVRSDVMNSKPKELTKKFLKTIWEGCERAKHDLSNFNSTSLFIDCCGEELEYPNFTRADFVSICKKELNELDAIIRTAFGSIVKGVTEVLMVGGSSRMSWVKEMVKDYVHPKCLFTPAIVPEEAVVTGAIIKASIVSHDSTFSYAYVDDFAYNSVHATMNGTETCLIQSQQCAVFKHDLEPLLTVLNTPTFIQISQSSAGYYAELQLGAPTKVWFQLDDSGQIVVQLDKVENVSIFIADQNLLSMEQTEEFKLHLLRYKCHQKRLEEEERLESERKRRELEEERARRQRKKEDQQLEEFDREMARLQKEKEDREKLMEEVIVMEAKSQGEEASAAPMEVTEYGCPPLYAKMEKMKQNEDEKVGSRSESKEEEATDEQMDESEEALDDEQQPSEDTVQEACFRRMEEMQRRVNRCKYLKNKELIAFRELFQSAHQASKSSAKVLNEGLYFRVIKEAERLMLLNSYLQRLEAIHNSVYQHTSVFWDSLGIRSKMGELKNKQTKMLNTRRLPSKTLWTKEELIQAFEVFVQTVVKMTDKRKLDEKFRRELESHLQQLCDED